MTPQDFSARVSARTRNIYDLFLLVAYRGVQFTEEMHQMLDALLADEPTRQALTELDSVERWAVWARWARTARFPGLSLRFLERHGLLDPIFDRLKFIVQDPLYHPEGNVWSHTLQTVDQAFARMRYLDKDRRAILLLAALHHDVGKAEMDEDGNFITFVKNGRITSPKHAVYGVRPARDWFERMGFEAEDPWINQVLLLVKHHMDHLSYAGGDRMVVNFVKAGGDMQLLHRLVQADQAARDPGAEQHNRPIYRDTEPSPGMERMMNTFSRLNDEGIFDRVHVDPLLRGRDLIDAGLDPHHLSHVRIICDEGLEMAPFAYILKKALLAQEQGAFIDHDGAVRWLRAFLDSSPLRNELFDVS